MIEINLVPENMRKKRRSRSAGGAPLALPREALIGIVGGLGVLLVVVHLLLQGLVTIKFMQLKSYESRLSPVGGGKENVDQMLERLKLLQAKYKSVEQIVGKDSIRWSEILNEISNNLPRGVWLSRITLEKDTLLMQGSAVSKGKEDMLNVHTFTANLKASEAFLAPFSNLELGMIKSRQINVTPVADFTIRVDLKKAP